jgi:branched-chain amino acid transport system ATP-binding protein
MQTVSGLLKAKSGEIAFFGQDLRAIEPHRIVELGWPRCRNAAASSPSFRSRKTSKWAPSPARTKTTSPRTTKRFFSAFPRLYERRKQLAGTHLRR